MYTKAILFGALLAAGACGCSSHSTKSDAGKAYTYDCSGLGKGWSDCTDKADAQCGAHNYNTISQNGSADAKNASGNSEMKRTLVVSCK